MPALPLTGLLRRLRDDLPAVVAAGRREVEGRVRVAHWVGEMAVNYGRNELQRRMTATGTVIDVAPAELPSPAPFDGYDDLPADQLVQLLPKLPVAELSLIRLYEQSKRGRRTVLAKIDQLIEA